ncbi:hypothetical protein GLYMA_12G218651v4 [Glycine max]|nr:hypothetical protein GLYMA_12G218651v4 [Glycine max]KAH1144357.1 hypothetical protein GYH30_034536 [Glycine max]
MIFSAFSIFLLSSTLDCVAIPLLPLLQPRSAPEACRLIRFSGNNVFNALSDLHIFMLPIPFIIAPPSLLLFFFFLQQKRNQIVLPN